ncbi:hypothetical protein GRF29_106g209626 [Pseudopithomyces chartarum]|uniref:mRNA export factor GLE1 n=1 Tax=Pseudopithomyces chartarum TaxID=1892770 RepID=A0AAN6RE09_9PLEO|nr:hypothetical protein GRF29_106g209626 [Pseudopithomyces chartarum]
MPPRSGTSSASMNTSTSFSSSWLGSSPSRQSPSRQSPHRNGVRSPPAKIIREFYESPTKLLTLEYTQLLSNSDREFCKKLDEDAVRRASIHQEQLAKAAAEHKRIMEVSEREMEILRLREEAEQIRKNNEQQEELQRLKEENMKREVEAQKRQLEAKLREEQISREAAEAQKKQQEAAARARAEKEREEAARKKKEEDERRAQEAAAASQQPSLPQPQPVQPAAASSVTPAAAPTVAVAAPLPTQNASTQPSADKIQVHNKYLALHGTMKKFRKNMQEWARNKDNPLKPVVGDIRRNMNKRMGQITIDVNDSRNAINSIRAECFQKAIDAGGPIIDIRPYLVSHQIDSEENAQYPQLLLYSWICFEKALISQWYNEASKEDGRIIGQLSLIAASLYLDANFMCKGGVPMTDTLLAKLHRICPMLFGIRGDLGANRAGLGLDRIHPNEADMNRYSQLMTGVGAGYAAITHKKFGKKPPAIPISEYWRTVVLICNTPADALYPGHFLVLQGLLRDNVRKFIMTYGVAAMAVLRRATIDLPNRVPAVQPNTPEARPGLAAAASLVKVLPDVWQKKDNIDIR